MTGAREGRRGRAWTSRNRVNAGGIGMLGQRQVKPRWADYPVQIHVGGEGFRSGGGCPPPEGNQESGIEVGAGRVNKYVTISDRA